MPPKAAEKDGGRHIKHFEDLQRVESECQRVPRHPARSKGGKRSFRLLSLELCVSEVNEISQVCEK
jgi:hypothetical protein